MAHLSRPGTRSLQSQSSRLTSRCHAKSSPSLIINIKQFRSLSLSLSNHCHPPTSHRVTRVNNSPSVFTHTQQHIHSLSAQRKFSKFRIPSIPNAQHHPIKLSSFQFAASSSQKKDYYETLGVSRNAKDTEVKKAFYKVESMWIGIQLLQIPKYRNI